MLRTENNPPLFFIIMHFWVKFFGISPVSVRFLPYLFSSLTAILMFLFGKKFFNLQIGILASLLFTFSNYHLHFAHEVRVYALFALLTTSSMYAFFSLIQEKKRWYFMILVVSNILLIYAHFFGFFILIIQGISVISFKTLRQSIFKTYIYATLITFVAYLPYLPLFLHRFTASFGGTWVEKPKIEGLYSNLRIFSNEPVNTVIFLSIIAIAGLTFIFKKINLKPKTGIYSKIIVIWFLFPYLFIFAVSFKLPMFLDRYLVFISIGYYFTIAGAVFILSKLKPFLLTFFTIALVFMMIFTFSPKRKEHQEIKELVEIIKSKKSKETAIYICPYWNYRIFVYHYNLDIFKDYKNTQKHLEKQEIYTLNNSNSIKTQTLKNASSIIYLDGWSELVDPNELIYKKIHKSFPKVDSTKDYKGFRAYFFEK